MSDWAGSPHDRHCVHGTPIGDPFGPDYLCGYCEDGVTLAEYFATQSLQAKRQRVEAASRSEGAIFRKLCDEWLPKGQYSASVATTIVNHWWDDMDRLQVECAEFDRLTEQFAVAA